MKYIYFNTKDDDFGSVEAENVTDAVDKIEDMCDGENLDSDDFILVGTVDEVREKIAPYIQ